MENPSLNFVEEDLNDKLKPILDFPVIAVGASAGGLEAVTDMFHDVPEDTGMSFVLVLHLDPNHESLMAELLSRKTQLDVRQVKNGDTLAIDTIHVIPPGLRKPVVFALSNCPKRRVMMECRSRQWQQILSILFCPHRK